MSDPQETVSDSSELVEVPCYDSSEFFDDVNHQSLTLPTVAEVGAEAKQRATAIFYHYTVLNGILLRHETTIRKRWTDRSRQQRINILLKVWPGMPSNHRPDYEAFKRIRHEPELRAESDTGSCMWPYINQEDLSQPRSILLLLNARGREIPSSFAAADLDAMRLGLECRAIERIFLSNWTMILRGVTTEGEYGKLLSWNDHPDALYWLKTKKQFGLGDGLMILKAQDRLMKFLVDFCLVILHDIDKNMLAGSIYPVQPELRLRSEYELRGFESQAWMAAEAPYRVPAKLELGRIESLLAAKIRAAKDLIWALREDPDYCRKYITDSREYLQELIKHSDYSLPTTGRERLYFEAGIIGNILTDIYLELDIFSELHQQVQELVALQRKYESIISPIEDLPGGHLFALVKFRRILNEGANLYLGLLKQATMGSPQLQKFYSDSPSLPETVFATNITPEGIQMTKVESELIYLLQTLWENGDDLFFLTLPYVVDELQRLLLCEPTASDLICNEAASIISNISVISLCLRQIDISRSWTQNFEDNAKNMKNDLRESSDIKIKSRVENLESITPLELIRVVPLARQVLGPFSYPFGMHRTKENVEKLRQAEQNLDNFWALVDSLALQMPAVRNLLSHAQPLQRTPEWTEGQYYEQTTAAQANTKTVKAKAKVKADETMDKQSTKIVQSGLEEVDDKPQPTFRVSRRALKVFRTLFFDPESTTSPRSVPWQDFLYAMRSVGFAPQQLYGQVWHFSPDKVDVEESIQCCEPRHGGKMPFMIARFHGRRLTRAYSWTGSMFGLKQ